MHGLVGREAPCLGHAGVGPQEGTTVNDAALTRLRRDHSGLVFQSFRPVPTLAALENCILALDLGDYCFPSQPERRLPGAPAAVTPVQSAAGPGRMPTSGGADPSRYHGAGRRHPNPHRSSRAALGVA